MKQAPQAKEATQSARSSATDSSVQLLQKSSLAQSIGQSPRSNLQKKAAADAHASPRMAAQAAQLQGAFGNAGKQRNGISNSTTPRMPPIQKMSIRGTAKAPVLAPAKAAKHVKADAAQGAAALANHTDSTFVNSADKIINAVNGIAHDFNVTTPTAVARVNNNANVEISQWTKRGGIMGANNPVDQTITNAATSCEIGVKKKGGEDTLVVDHFTKN